MLIFVTEKLLQKTSQWIFFMVLQWILVLCIQKFPSFFHVWNVASIFCPKLLWSCTFALFSLKITFGLWCCWRLPILERCPAGRAWFPTCWWPPWQQPGQSDLHPGQLSPAKAKYIRATSSKTVNIEKNNKTVGSILTHIKCDNLCIVISRTKKKTYKRVLCVRVYFVGIFRSDG